MTGINYRYRSPQQKGSLLLVVQNIDLIYIYNARSNWRNNIDSYFHKTASLFFFPISPPLPIGQLFLEMLAFYFEIWNIVTEK